MADENETENGGGGTANDIVTALMFTLAAPGTTATVSMEAVGNAPALRLQYADGHAPAWYPFVVGETVITLDDSTPSVSFMIDASAPDAHTRTASSSTDYNRFVITGSVFASGAVDSLLSEAFIYQDIPLEAFSYAGLFEGCTGLKSAPLLLSTHHAPSCYASMFSGSGITAAPEIPPGELSLESCSSMFAHCVDLETAPSLEGLSPARECFSGMFLGCVKLEEAPRLDWHSLTEGCYSQMFQGCTSLTEAHLDIISLADASYACRGMFSGCSGLTDVYVSCYEYTADSTIFMGWLDGTAAAGVLHAPLGAYAEVFDLPAGWSVATIGIAPPPGCLTFTAEAPGSSVSLTTGVDNAHFMYSTDGTNWIGLLSGVPVTLQAVGDTVSIAAFDLDHGCMITHGMANFHITGRVAASGSVNSLCDRFHRSVNQLAEKSYEGLFHGCTGLTSAPDLPSSGLAAFCYRGMFRGCNALETAPELPAGAEGVGSLAQSCYEAMFEGCSSLVAAPALPARALPEGCYRSMFADCTALAEAPAIQATSFGVECCSRMFSFCTGITTSPNLLAATTLESGCCESMFYGCRSLVTAPALPSTTLAPGCYATMFFGCSSLVNAPVLPASVLVRDCYFSMFGNCTSLRRIVVGFKAWADDVHATDNWVVGVPDSGEFHCRGGLTRIYDASHIPGPAPLVLTSVTSISAEDGKVRIGDPSATVYGENLRLPDDRVILRLYDSSGSYVVLSDPSNLVGDHFVVSLPPFPAAFRAGACRLDWLESGYGVVASCRTTVYR